MAIQSSIFIKLTRFFYVKMRRGKFICTDLEKRACKKSDVKIDDRTLNDAENWSSHQQWSHHGKKDLFRIQKGLLDADASIVMFQTNNNVGFLNVPYLQRTTICTFR